MLAKEQFGLRGRALEDKGMEFIPFTAATRMSGVNYEGNEIRKGAADSVRTYVEAAGGVFSSATRPSSESPRPAAPRWS